MSSFPLAVLNMRRMACLSAPSLPILSRRRTRAQATVMTTRTRYQFGIGLYQECLINIKKVAVRGDVHVRAGLHNDLRRRGGQGHRAAAGGGAAGRLRQYRGGDRVHLLVEGQGGGEQRGAPLPEVQGGEAPRAHSQGEGAP